MNERAMTDGEMADAISVSREYVRLLRAGRRNPSVHVSRRIATVTNGDVDFDLQEGIGDGAMDQVRA